MHTTANKLNEIAIISESLQFLQVVEKGARPRSTLKIDLNDLFIEENQKVLNSYIFFKNPVNQNKEKENSIFDQERHQREKEKKTQKKKTKCYLKSYTPFRYYRLSFTNPQLIYRLKSFGMIYNVFLLLNPSYLNLSK
uniref:Uncharacterized protein n=1 Tax=Glossina pallidipes TaxID=7398 RepID=A0A1B0A1E7_GLOPL